jgi:hypothetical protein
MFDGRRDPDGALSAASPALSVYEHRPREEQSSAARPDYRFSSF